MSFGPDQLTAREAAEALYLAAHIDAGEAGGAWDTRDTAVGGVVDRKQEEWLKQPKPEAERPPTLRDEPSPDTVATSPDQQANWRSVGLEPTSTHSVASLDLALPTLAGELDIGRALRPLNSRVASLTELELDEDATAERAAEEGFWLPVMKPAAARWLTVVLLDDSSASMSVWRHIVAAFTTFLERQGAFKNVLKYRFDGDSADQVVLGSEEPGTRKLSASELIQPQRVALVLTDGIGKAWRSGATDRLLAELGAGLPVAVLHLLPEGAWHRTALKPYRARARCDRATVPNARLSWDVAAAELDFELPDDRSIVPIPLLALDPDSLSWWARLVTGTLTGWTNAQLTFADVRRQASAETSPAGQALEAVERVLSFRANASPTAFKLATFLAAVPLELSLMELVQNVMLPDSGPSHLSEILTGGLVRRAEEARVPQLAKGPGLDFHKGVREELLTSCRRRDTARVLHIVGEHLGPRVEAFGRLTDVLATPDTAQVPPVTAETAPLIRLQSTALRALSGPYLNPARRLTAALERLQAEQKRSIHDTPAIATSAIKDRPMPEVSAQTSSSPILTAPGTPASHVEAEPDITSAVEARLTTTERRPGDPPSVWGNVPARNPHFTGRDELLEDLHGRLQTGVTAVLPEALHGMGGVGKSQIAVEYVYRHTSDYDLVWWIPSDGQSQVASALVDLAQQMGVVTTDEANIAGPAVREALRLGKPYRNWLLIFDNAESPETVRPFFPTDGPGRILVTSRNPQWAAIARPLEVNVFEREESKQLLHRRGPTLDDKDAERLAQVMGDLPLAIDQAAAWLAETGMPAAEYLRLFEEKTNELLGAVETTDYQLSVAAAWNVSLDRLRERQPAALQLLQVCSFFAPEPISRRLLSGVHDAPVPPELLAALRDPIRLARAMREINRYALARIDHTNNTIQLHRLVQAVLIGQMSPVHRDEMRHAAHMLLAKGDPNNPTSPADWPRYRGLLPHVQASGAIECENRWVRNLVLNTIQFLYQWGEHEVYRRLAQQTVDTWSERFGPDDEQTLSATQWLGRALRLLGHYDRAREVNEQALAQMREALGEEHEATNLMMNSVAADLQIQGKFEAARELNQRAAEIAERVFGEDDPSTLVARHNLGVSIRLCGDFRATLELNIETHDREVQVHGDRERLTLATLGGIGLDELESGQYMAARARLESTVVRTRLALGEDNPQTVLVSQVLAVARRRAGDHRGAYEISEEALERFRRRYGKDDPQSVSAAANLAVDLRQTGDLPAARRLGERTLERYRSTLGESHPHTLAAAVNHAVVLRLQGEAQAAHELDESTHSELRTALGPEHPLTLICATNLASDLAAVGEPQAAHDLGAVTLELSTRTLGEDHPSTLVCAANLALDLRALDHAEEAATLHGRTMERLRHVLGDSHPATDQVARYARLDCDANLLPL